MPHKRAKRSIREQNRADRMSDLPPSQATFSNEDMPKSMARVLNAEAVQKAWREKKRVLALEEGGDGEGGKRKRRKTDDAAGNGHTKNELKIKPGESLRHFKRRVEDDLRPVIRTAMKKTTSVSKQKSKASQRDVEQLSNKSSQKGKDAVNKVDAAADDAPARQKKGKGPREGIPEFAQSSTSAPKRLNDVVLAPPELKPAPRLNRLAKRASAKKSKDGEAGADENEGGNGVVSAAQKRMMELEREKAISRYRALKEARLEQQQQNEYKV